MDNKVEVMLEKSNECGSIISSFAIKRHMDCTILKGGICCSLSYILPATMILHKEGGRISQAIYQEALPSLGMNRNFPLSQRHLPLQYFEIKLPHP